jgi:hypothetical protein
MKILISIVLIFCVARPILAQQPNRSDSLGSKKPMVIIDSFTTSIEYLIIDPGNIESINVYKDSAAIAQFGDKAKNGVITIQPKPKVKLLRINQVLDKYDAPDSLRKFRVRINDAIVDRPDLLLFDESYVSGISTLVADDWSDLRNVKSEKFLNIMTKK